ncbi:MAG: toll/interleukin-1 receptor domain-containing protein, partial [Acidobacteriaceae bacterium]|nr:toll/interleukin-1 receptor domain-containing protein [Acidobacteriaceae bacterium]
LVKVYVAEAAIAPGNNWLEQLVGALQEADMYVVLCSQLSVDRRWINIEVGAGLSRGKRIVPICHTDLNTSQLQRPLADYQAVDASDIEGLRRLYQIIAEGLGSSVPGTNFAELAAKVKEFEERHRKDKAAMMESVDAASTTSTTDLMLPQPRVLCVSSKQFEETVGKDLELIRRSFPDMVHHELSVTSAEVRRLLVDNQFDIVHVAAYICPVYGDIVFSNVDPKTKNDVSGNRDMLGPEQFAQLVKTSQAKLVVLANNETTPLVARLLPFTNVAFALEPMDLKALRDWIQEFYRLLATGRTLSDACRKAFAQYQTPMRLYPRLPSTRRFADAA